MRVKHPRRVPSPRKNLWDPWIAGHTITQAYSVFKAFYIPLPAKTAFPVSWTKTPSLSWFTPRQGSTT